MTNVPHVTARPPRTPVEAVPRGGDDAGTTISWRPLLRLIWALAAVLVVVGPTVGALDALVPDRDGPVRGALTILARIVGLGGENTIPAWFASALLLTLAAAFALVALCQRLAGGAGAPYILFGATALALSVDEAVAIHEELGRITAQLVDRSAVVTYTWLVPGAVLAVLVGILLLRLARRVPRLLRRRLLVAGALYCLGALVFEGLTGLVDANLTSPCVEEGCVVVQGPAYRVLNTLEEGLELAGVILALRAALSGLQVRRAAQGLTVSLAGTSTT